MYKTTSRQSYDLILPTLTERQRLVLGALKALGKATMHQVSDYLVIELHKISGRFGELEKMKEIYAADRDGRRTVWKVVEKEPRTLQLL